MRPLALLVFGVVTCHVPIGGQAIPPLAPAPGLWQWETATKDHLPPLHHVEDAVKPDIPGASEPEVQEQFLRYRRLTGTAWFRQVQSRSHWFLPLVQDHIDRAGIPDALKWLPWVESEFLATAVSRSGAVGLWQFMENSMAPWLRKDQWEDDRRDFVASTEAALEKLQYNHSVTGDWYLAIAAYNSGLGALQRARSRMTPGHNIWDLQRAGVLSEETAAYIPKLVALGLLMERKAQNGVPISWDEGLDWVTVETSAPLDLATLVRRTGLPAHPFLAANARYLQGVVPAGISSKPLKIPSMYADALEDYVERIEGPRDDVK